MADDWFAGGSNGAVVSVAAVLDSDGTAGLLEMVQAGALVSLGCTADGGALGVTITVDGQWRREYFRDSTELSDWVAGGLGPVLRACEVASSERASRKRSRRAR